MAAAPELAPDDDEAVDDEERREWSWDRDPYPLFRILRSRERMMHEERKLRSTSVDESDEQVNPPANERSDPPE